jgi:hypothetical protein
MIIKFLLPTIIQFVGSLNEEPSNYFADILGIILDYYPTLSKNPSFSSLYINIFDIINIVLSKGDSFESVSSRCCCASLLPKIIKYIGFFFFVFFSL